MTSLTTISISITLLQSDIVTVRYQLILTFGGVIFAAICTLKNEADRGAVKCSDDHYIYHTVRTLTLHLPLDYLIRHNRKSYPNFKVSLTFEVHLEMTSASVQGVSYELMSSTFFFKFDTFFLKLS